MSAPTQQRCSELSLAVDESMQATAPTAGQGFLMIEDRGPWGPQGLTQASIDPATVEHIERSTALVSVMPMLFRPLTDRGQSDVRRVIAARITAGARQLVVATVNDAELMSLDFEAFGGDLLDIAPDAQVLDAPVAFVCTHAKRDRCCAIYGRALAAGLDKRYNGKVFECSHLGGHRFAPSMLLLPSGICYGRLELDQALEAVEHDMRGEVLVGSMRGRSDVAAVAQAADIALREKLDITALDDIQVGKVARADGTFQVSLQSEQHGSWLVQIEVLMAPPRPQSCTGSVKSARIFDIQAVTPA